MFPVFILMEPLCASINALMSNLVVKDTRNRGEKCDRIWENQLVSEKISYHIHTEIVVLASLIKKQKRILLQDEASD